MEGPKSDNATEEQIKIFEQDKVFIRTRYEGEGKRTGKGKEEKRENTGS